MRAAFFLTILLLTLGLPVPAGHAAPAETLLLEITDPPNDVAPSYQGQTGPTAPPGDYANLVDVTKVRILDLDEEFLAFEVYTQAPFQPPKSFSSGANMLYVYHNVLFQVPGQGGVKVPALLQFVSYVVAEVPPTGGTDLRPMLQRASVCFVAGASQEGCELFDARFLQAEVVEGHALVKVPKSLLMRDDQHRVTSRSANLPTRLWAGDEFTSVYVQSHGYPTSILIESLEPRLADRAPNLGTQSFRLAHTSPTQDVRFSGIPGAVVAGEENVLPVEVTNLGSNKRIINFSVEQISASEDGAWKASITPRVTLGAGKGTNLTIRVTPPSPGTDLRASAFFRIRADVITEPGTIALGYAYFDVQPPLDATRNTFYVHGASYGFFDLPVPVFAYGHGGLSRHESDPVWRDQPIAFTGNGLLFSGNTITKWFFSEPVPNPARLRPGEPIKARFEFEAAAAATGTLTALVRMGDQSLGETTKAVAFQQGKTPFEFDIAPLGTANRIDPANGSLYMQMRLTLDAPQSLAFGTNLLSLHLLPRVSWLKLPVEREERVVPREVNFRVALVGTEDLQSFVNRGRTTVYELDLRNEDERRLGLELALDNVTAGWQYEIRPAARFRLDPSDSAHIGVLATAPHDAPEGSTSVVRVVAREVETGEVVAGQWLRAVVVSVDIENETFAARDEDAAKLDTPAKSSTPTIGLVAAALVLLGLAVKRRRR